MRVRLKMFRSQPNDYVCHIKYIVLYVLLLTLSVSPAASTLEPPINPYLANSVWPMSHRNPYNQASSPHRGIEAGDKIDIDFQRTLVTSITLAYSNNYDKTGKPVVWGSTVGSVYKMDLSSSKIKKWDSKLKPINEDPLSGAYTLVDRDNYFYVPGDRLVNRYGDATLGDPASDIVLEAVFEVPNELLTQEDEHIVGINMTYDGYIALATSHGLVMVVSRDFVHYHAINLGDEQVSNSIAVDEEGGIYIVTNRAMHRVQWSGESLKHVWRTEYETGPDTPFPGRLGTGSGSTPTLMGKQGSDKFVVITDGGELMNLVLMWRDEVPEDWQAIAPGVDRRIAAQYPITFGVSERTRSISEQSVLVRGYGAMVVNNEYAWDTANLGLLTVLLSNIPANAPYGVEKFSWNPSTRQLVSNWSNQISCPNGIPTMSESSNLAYCWGQRSGKWVLEGMNWETGSSEVVESIGYLLKYNSIYAATQVVDQGQVVSGTAGGITRLGL